MRYRIVIKEERSYNIKTSILKQLEPYSKDESYFVTFTDLEKVGINPNNRFATPIGVYAYSLKDLWNDWVAGDMFFGQDRQYVNLLKLNTNKVFDFQNYNNYQQDYQFLKNYYETNYEQLTGISFEDHIKNIKQKATLYEHTSEAAEIWDIIQTMLQINDRKIGGLVTKRSTVLWNKLLTKMGYEAIIDKGANIHLLQSSQAIFLTPSSYKIIDRFVNKQYGQKLDQDSYWGSDKQPFWRIGPNPTVDIVVFKREDGELKVLLIKRTATSKAEPNKYAFPGGFHDTNQPKGHPWKNDRESVRQAAFRELAEETELWIPSLNNLMKLVGTYEGNNRDPRDNEEAWSRTTAFAILLPQEVNSKVTGRDDAQEARWIPVSEATKMQLAFDHNQILQDALATMQLNENNIFKKWNNYVHSIKEAVHSVHHGSAHDFVIFDPTKTREFGFHFGSLETATHIGSQYVKKYEITINNPLQLDDVYFWEPASILRNMREKGYIDSIKEKEILQSVNSQALVKSKSGTPLRQEKNEVLKDVLEQMGYDGIIYENRGESGSTAYVIFRPEQAKFIERIDEAKKKDYKPNFSKEKEQGLHGWFARNDGKGWVNCRTGGPCGRDSADSGGKYPACRPTKAQCKSAGKGPLRKKKSSKAISWTKKKKD